jgi:hypothetical protein
MGSGIADDAAAFESPFLFVRHITPIPALPADSVLQIRRIEENPAIVLRTQMEATALEGDNYLEVVRWRDNQTVLARGPTQAPDGAGTSKLDHDEAMTR